jgi:hypothetical protein
MENNSGKRYGIDGISLAGLLLLILLISFSIVVSAASAPEGPSRLNVTYNETSSSTSAAPINVSGGYISTINLTARTQNSRWKGMVGWLNGKFALDDEAGSTLFDWTTVITGGKVYATRNSSGVTWVQIQCANRTILETENYNMNHTRSDDNLTSTFSDTSHRAFTVGSVPITGSTCPTLNTFISNNTQQGEFEEVALFDGVNDAAPGNVVYAALLNQTKVGFDGNSYDFQMLVPERGYSTWTSSTAYYLYVELG